MGIGVSPNFPWAANNEAAVEAWSAACAAPHMKHELLFSLLVIDTVLLWQHSPPTRAMEAPELSAYRSWSSSAQQQGHHREWIYFALLKAMSGEDIRLPA